jgi:peptidoglycan/LPS O-acetylase OafA/YrhL
MANADSRLTTLDALRGLAALSVVWFHLASGRVPLVAFPVLNRFSEYGAHGVEAFFVISGFVIPLALTAGAYAARDYPRFLVKRWFRLYPPYVVGVALHVGLLYAAARTPGFRGEAYHLSLAEAVQFLTCTREICGHQVGGSTVFWTLAIEMQYYLAVGLVFPLLAGRAAWAHGLLFAAMGVLPLLLPRDAFLSFWLNAFLPGVLTFYYRRALLAPAAYLSLLLVAGASNYASHGPVVAVVATGTAVAIAWGSSGPRPLVWAGAVSYSLYLVHVPVGLRVLSLSQRLSPSPFVAAAGGAVAVGASVLVAWVMYRLVEMPSSRWSSRVKYGRARGSGAGNRVGVASRQESATVASALAARSAP